MEIITIKRVEGKRVRDPQSGVLLGSEAVAVERNGYWIRRMNDGSVVEVPPVQSPKKNSKQEA